MGDPTVDNYPDHGHEDPDDDDFEPRDSSPEDFLDPVEFEEEG